MAQARALVDRARSTWSTGEGEAAQVRAVGAEAMVAGTPANLPARRRGEERGAADPCRDGWIRCRGVRIEPEEGRRQLGVAAANSGGPLTNCRLGGRERLARESERKEKGEEKETVMGHWPGVRRRGHSGGR